MKESSVPSEEDGHGHGKHVEQSKRKVNWMKQTKHHEFLFFNHQRFKYACENEDTTVMRTELPSATLLSALVQSVVNVIFFQGDIWEIWEAEALKWAMECTTFKIICI